MLVNGLTGASLGLVIFTAANESIPRDLLHAARVDGATTAQLVWRIILPLLRWPVMFVTIYQTLSLLASFEAILLLTNGSPLLCDRGVGAVCLPPLGVQARGGRKDFFAFLIASLLLQHAAFW